MKINKGNTSDREIVTERRFNYPREVVFDAWTDPARIAVWWGPHGFTTTVMEMDVRPGGVWRYVMHGPDGTDYPNLVRYLEVATPVRLEYMHGDGIDESADFHVTVMFHERGKTTDVVMRAVFDSVETLEKVKGYGAVEGARQTLERLEAHLATTGGLPTNGPDMDVVDLDF